MRLALHNVTVVYFPIWTMSLFENFSPTLYWTIRVLELVCLIPAALLTFFFCRIACRSRMFHFNLTIILVSILGQYFECLLARLLVVPYQEGWISIRDTVVENEQTGILHASASFLPLLVGGFVRTHYVLSVALAIPCVVIERIIASLAIRTYEKHPRIFISTTLILSSHTLSIFLSYQLIQWKFSYIQILVTFTIVTSVTVTIFAVLYVYNSSVTRRLELQHRRYGYHLGKRFQARENLQSLKLVRRLTVVAVTLFLFAALFIFLVISQLAPRSTHRICLQLSEIVLNLNPLFVIPPIIWRIPAWKTKMLELLPYRIRKKLSGASRSIRPLDYRVRSGDDSNAYWRQFTRSW